MQRELFNLKKIIKDSDKVVVFKKLFSNPDFILWQDVEYAINSGKYHVEILDNKNKVSVAESRYFWHSHPNQDKESLFNLINDGKTFVIHQFSLFNEKIAGLAADIEHVFPVQCDVHVYGGIGYSGSFNPHVDIPSNFIIQLDGVTKWKVYKNYATDLLLQEEINTFFDPEHLEVDHEIDLEPGDMIYIPARRFHAAFPEGNRLSLSIPCRSIKYNTEQSIHLNRNFYKIDHGN